TARALQSALERSAPEPLEILVDRQVMRLDPGTITHLEAAGDYVEVHAESGRHLTKARLGELADTLEPAGFIRVHRSFVVRAGAVQRRSSTELDLGGATVPVGRSYRAAVRSVLQASGNQ
ncbi:MAG: LytTR family transcriptional regulator, partial [Rhodothermales bacterium]|nr:LytTR family transcriptional regulator [Rhodothermales bacterium]